MKLTRFLCLLALLVLVAACAKGPAEEALKEAEATVENLGEDVEKYAGEGLAELRESLSEARAKFDEGDYAVVVETAQGIPAKVDEVKQAAEARKQELTEGWNSMSEALPAKVEEIQGRIEELSKSRRLRRSEGVDEEAVEAAKSSLTQVQELWGQAKEAYQNADLAKAVELANSVKTQLAQVASNPKMTAE